MKKPILFLLLIVAGIFKVAAINNSIAFIYRSGNFCEHTFRDTAGTRTFTPTSYYWDFGDGNTSTLQHARHDYKINNSYVVTHIISDGTNYDTAIINIVVACKANNPLEAAFVYYINDTLDPNLVYFTNMSGGRIVSYNWDFGNPHTSNLESPTYGYPTSPWDMTYTVCLKIKDSAGNSDSSCQNILIRTYDSCKAFDAAFNWQQDTVCNSGQFTNYSHYTATNFLWDFGDGSTSTLKNPYHHFNNPDHGTFNIKLKAWSNRCTDSFSYVIKPLCNSCYTVTAMVTMEVDSTNLSKAILYNASYGPIQSHFWDFGDGSTSTQAAPQHVYTSPGSINLLYIVTDTLNCSDTAELFFTIDSLGNIKRGNIQFTLQVIDRTQSSSVSKTEAVQPLLLIFPQPANTVIQIMSTDNRLNVIHISDITGREIYSGTLNVDGKLEIQTNLWGNGLYLLQDNLGHVHRFLIQH